MKTKKLNQFTVYSLKYIEDCDPKHYFLTKERMTLFVVNYEKHREHKHYFLLATYKDGATLMLSDDRNSIRLRRGCCFRRKIIVSIKDMDDFYKRSEVLTIKAGEKPNKFIRDTYFSIDLKKLLEKAPKNKFDKNKLEFIEQITITDRRDL